MLTLTFRLRFPDGECVRARISAESSLEDAPVCYSGPCDRLPLAPTLASAVELKAYLHSFARELGAAFSEEVEGLPIVLEGQEP